LFFFLVISNPDVYADAKNISTDKKHYQNGDIITVTGNSGISNSKEAISVVIRNLNDDYVVLVSDISDESGAFEMKIDVESHFLIKGHYFAQMFIDDVASNKKTYFDYSPDGATVVYSDVMSFLSEKSSNSTSSNSTSSNSISVQQISIEEIKLVDSFGSKVESVVADEPIQISSDIVNLMNKNLPFTYIIQIRDHTDAVIYISWFSGMMSDDQIYNVALSWIPKERGLYQIDVFIWESFSNVVSLSEPESFSIVVT